MRWLALLLLPVLLAHLWLGEAVHSLRQGWTEAAAPMPARLVVSYVRELKAARPAAPVAQRVAKPKPVARPAQAKVPPEPAVAGIAAAGASAPFAEPAVVEAPTEAASEPGTLPTSELAQTSPAASEPAASASAIDEVVPGPEWPPSTLLSYRLSGNYRGEVHGNAQVEWIRQGEHYQMHLDVAIGPSFAPLISRRMSSDGRLTPAGIAPQRYDEDTRVMFSQRRRSTLLFHGDSVTMANGSREPVPSGVQDAASQFVQLTRLFLTGAEPLRAGHVIDIPLVLPKRQYLWRYEILGEEELQTAMGPLQTWHLKPSKAAGGGDLTAEVWIAPSLQYLPVRLRIRQDEQTYIDLMLNAAPKQGAP
ncbi:DUF3108 domain-containing protein [Paucibacter sp. B2R-40]|uniref:DUF3108 domain-containing protein n=1 Tax=Paucibacter sp. B2R-40 TaxID=2893554 RepID=UPI0021E4671E|nr:DUF3108 domain-containing protein [Paucibacter sp. B2R-40]MCV2354551.1 DUF3108 domain-containing protein [Paucibacter sp. B2R-40]